MSDDRNIWFISDTHFSHSNFLNFVDDKGEKIRKFDNVQEMDELMIDNWNSAIKPQDKVYHLGDVAMGRPSADAVLAKLNGKKRLIVGNHDVIKGDLIRYFQKITMWRIFKEYDFVCTHVPLREDSMLKTTFNLHGHIHQQPSPSLRHVNMCVEHWNYRPVHLDEIMAELDKRRIALEWQQDA